VQKKNWRGYTRWSKKISDRFCRLDTILACDRRTDVQTNRQISHESQDCAYTQRRAGKNCGCWPITFPMLSGQPLAFTHILAARCIRYSAIVKNLRLKKVWGAQFAIVSVPLGYNFIVLAFIVLAFCIFNPYCCDFCAAFRRNKEQEFVRPRWPYDTRPSVRAEKYIRDAGP